MWLLRPPWRSVWGQLSSTMSWGRSPCLGSVFIHKECWCTFIGRSVTVALCTLATRGRFRAQGVHQLCKNGVFQYIYPVTLGDAWTPLLSVGVCTVHASLCICVHLNVTESAVVVPMGTCVDACFGLVACFSWRVWLVWLRCLLCPCLFVWVFIICFFLLWRFLDVFGLSVFLFAFFVLM